MNWAQNNTEDGKPKSRDKYLIKSPYLIPKNKKDLMTEGQTSSHRSFDLKEIKKFRIGLQIKLLQMLTLDINQEIHNL